MDSPWYDLFELDRKTYLAVVDYTSRWFEVRQLHSVTASAVIRVLCEIFAAHGIPDTVISDNGLQYANQEFKEFARLGIYPCHILPHLPSGEWRGGESHANS